ncbi:MAG: polysaccharide biosynthesis protein [Oscillospiraceae bacterium]|nr:polysaccharide biosynthesis protein [Oscillospiraceae bacterium]
MKTNRQSFIHGAAILTVSLVIVKILGLLFKIPLTNILGGVGMGYYNTAYMLFSPVFSLAIGGLPAAVAKMIAENSALGRYRDVKKVFRISMVLYLLMGIAGTAVMVFSADFFVHVVKNPNAYWAVVAIAPTVLFGCIISAYRGYFEGLCDMRPTAVSQVVEMAVKLAAGLGFALWVMNYAAEQYELTGIVFGVVVQAPDQVGAAALPFAAAASVVGVSFSNVAGAVYLIIRRRRNDSITPEQRKTSPRPAGSRSLFKQLVVISFPICIGGFVLNVTSLIDLLSMMNRLNFLVREHSAALLEVCSGAIPAGMPLSDLPNYLYGCYTGLAVSIFGIIPAIAGVFAKSALPNIASSWARGNRDYTRRKIELVIRITALVTVPSGIGISVLAHPILSVLFSSRTEEVNIAAPVLAIMGIGVIFQAGSLLLFSILQALGYANLPVRHMAAGGVAKIVLNMLLMSLPSLHVNGAALSTAACYLLIFCLEFSALARITGMKFKFSNIFLRPIFAGILCGIAAKTSYGFLIRCCGKGLSVALAIGISAVLYLIAALCVKAVERNDLEMVPGGKKVTKVLEKMKLMR